MDVGPDGSLYVTDEDAGRIWRARPDGTIAVVAGLKSAHYWCDNATDPCGDGGPATEARFGACRPFLYGGGEDCWGPAAVAIDRSGNLLVYHLLSDRQGIERATTDAAYRYFLGLSLRDTLPDPSSMSVFRGRLGVEGHKKIFTEVVAQAREHGLVKDRLRLKDATHVIADVAVPTTLALVAQIRDKLLAAVESLDPVRVAGERARLEVLRHSTEGCNLEQRLVARVTHLREILAWVDELAQPHDPEQNRSWQQLLGVRQLAHKILTVGRPRGRTARARDSVERRTGDGTLGGRGA